MSTVTPFPNPSIDRAIAYTLQWEGGFSDDPRDPGGATNYGISLRFLLAEGKIERYDFDGDGDVDGNDVRQMTRAQAADVYRDRFWWPALSSLPELIAIKIFDFGVNMGPRQATKLVQRAVNEYAFLTTAAKLVVDGAWGQHTTSTFLAIAEKNDSALPLLLADLEDNAARFYFELAEARRSAREYLFGWLRRCYARPEL